MGFMTNLNLARGIRTVLSAGLVIAALGAAPLAQAQEIAPEHLALARKYVDLTDSASLYETSLIQTGIETMRQVITQNPEITQQTSAVIGEVIEGYVAEKGDLFDQFARVYAIRFSMEELTEIIAFYESPVGRKLSENNSSINGDLRRVLAVFTNNLRVEFLSRVRAGLREQGIEL
jgi:uncharacterized protein